MMKILLLFILSLLSGGLVVACDCLRTEGFCETFHNDAMAANPNGRVVLAAVSRKTTDKIEFKVLETLFGQHADGKAFHFLKGQIFNFDEFDTGEKYVFQLIQPLAEPQHYYHWCGTEYLAIEDDKVVGFIEQGVYEMPLKDFMKLQNCGVLKPSLEINPTLMSGNTLFISPKNWRCPANIDITVFNSLGQLMQEQYFENYFSEANIELMFDGMAAGVYYCKISYLGKSQTTRFTKLN